MNIKLLSQNAKVPTRGSELAAGYDLYVPDDTIINPGRNIVQIDIAIALKPGKEAHIRPRSGFSAKGFEGHRLTQNGYEEMPTRFDADVIQGTIDADYRNGIGVVVKSYEAVPFIVTAGTRIAQLVISSHDNDDFTIVEELDDTKRGIGGFGSTGTH